MTIEDTIPTKYPDDFVPDPLPEEIRESTNSMRFTTDVGTMGDGAGGIGGDDGPSNGVGVMGDVLAGAASAYGRDVLHTAGSIYLLTTLPPLFFALQGYRFWSGVIGGAVDGYAQDGVFGAVAGAINAVNPFAHVGISLANTVDEAEKGNYKAAGEHGYRTAVGIVGIAVAAIGVGVARGGGGAGGTVRVRHFTNSKGVRGIESDGVIRARDQNRVFTVKAQGKPGSPRDVEDALKIKRGHANHYVEFDAKPGEFLTVRNPKSGATETVFEGDVNLSGRNATFHKSR